MAMEENDRWSAHVEYLKLAIALATALIAAAAAIYVDTTKIPTDNSRYLLLFAISMFFLTLITSLWSLACLGTHLRQAGATGATDDAANAATTLANASFILLAISTGVLGVFFGLRTVSGAPSFERSIATAETAKKPLIDVAKGETASLKSLELQGQNYQMVFQVNPGPSTITVITDASGANLQSAKRQ
jgi:hypothetical protein